MASHGIAEPWNCWPGDICLTTSENILIGLGIAATILALAALAVWLVRR